MRTSTEPCLSRTTWLAVLRRCLFFLWWLLCSSTMLLVLLSLTGFDSVLLIVGKSVVSIATSMLFALVSPAMGNHYLELQFLFVLLSISSHTVVLTLAHIYIYIYTYLDPAKVHKTMAVTPYIFVHQSSLQDFLQCFDFEPGPCLSKPKEESSYQYFGPDTNFTALGVSKNQDHIVWTPNIREL